MKRVFDVPIPVMRVLRKLGQDIHDARRRRRITMKIFAERAGISRSTLSKVEKGDPTASMGSYASVLFVLGMLSGLEDLVDTTRDLVGLRLEEERLPKRVRVRKK